MNFVKLCEKVISDLELVEEASHYELTRISNATRTAKTDLTRALRNKNANAATQAKEELKQQKAKLAHELRPGLYTTRTEPLSEDELDQRINKLSDKYDFLILTVMSLGKIDQQIAELEENQENQETLKTK